MKTSLLVGVIFFQSLYVVFSIPLDTKSIELDKRVCEDTRSDCDTINHIGEPKASYCLRNRNDPEVSKCARTCGFCKVPAPPVVGECEDTRDDCSWIAKNNDDVAAYCDRHKNDAFIKQCQRTCGYCKAPAPPRICEDTRSDCDTINHIGEPKASYCLRNRNDPEVRKCARTCGFCKVPAPPIVGECEDTRDDCSWIAKHNDDVAAYCDRHKNDAFIKQCQRTCGYCKAPAPPRKCEDTRDDCSWIAKNNDDVAAYCDRHKNDAFIKQCQRTCGYCKAPAPPICEDTRRDCDTINYIGEPKASYCLRNRNDPEVKKCARTCGFC